MKKITVYISFTIFIAISSLFLKPQIVNANVVTNVTENDNGANSQSHVSVNSNTGDNTICQNGNCTTTSNGNGQSTVCINGQCQTSTGDINVTSNNGNDQVQITNNGGSQTQVTQSSTSNSNTTTSTAPVSPSPQPSLSPTPTPVLLSDKNAHQSKRHLNINPWYSALTQRFTAFAHLLFYFV